MEMGGPYTRKQDNSITKKIHFWIEISWARDQEKVGEEPER